MLAFSACNNEPSGSPAGVLPHQLDSLSNYSPSDAAALASAKGIVAEPVAASVFLEKIKADTSALLAVNFWKTDCAACLQLQTRLEKFGQETGGKIQLFFVNLDDANAAATVNLALRTGGFSATAFQLANTETAWAAALSPNWKGELPALFVQTADGLRQLYRQDFSDGELQAVLGPLIESDEF